ncbi:MAG: hypothetical protein KJ950_06850 [Proteobacteria bacterium]|nr:hypothetical protein [Pseudomonadota bacterium]MBU1686759.1 hypothetical protein [Pseudomonadota bacterium]
MLTLTPNAARQLLADEELSRSRHPVDQITQAAAISFMDATQRESPENLIYVDLLCRLALAENSSISLPAVAALYHRIIEPLSDDFQPASTRTGNMVLARLIHQVGRRPRETVFSQLLDHWQLYNESDLILRWEKVTNQPPIPKLWKKTVTKIFIPSRVTSGADIAITSIMAHRLSASFPNAQVILVGPAHLGIMFHDCPHISASLFEVNRQGNLDERILFWPQLAELIQQQIGNTPAGTTLLFDPDSRLTQLGLLPLLPTPYTFHFNSRSFGQALEPYSLSLAVNRWLNLLLNESADHSPQVCPPHSLRTSSALLCRTFRDQGCRNLLLINFGVGGNPRKRLGDPFEEELLTRLLNWDKTIILLDMGTGSEEKIRVEKLLKTIGIKGTPTDLLSDHHSMPPRQVINHGLVGFESSIGGLAAMAGQVDTYIGYDSCGQHLAAAAGIETITVFAGAPNERFIHRWTPWTKNNPVTVIPVAPGPDHPPLMMAAIIDKILNTINPKQTEPFGANIE